MLSVSQNGTEIIIEQIRPADLNPKIKKELQITLIWRPELQNLLHINHLPVYKQKSKKFVQQKLMEKTDWNQLKRQMCEELFERDYTLWNEDTED